MSKPKNETTILNRIEKLVDKLPYKTANISITLENKTYTLEKQKQLNCGFK